MRILFAQVREFAAKIDGSLAIWFAFSAPVVIAGIGATIDYNRRDIAIAQLQEAADSSVLQAIIDTKTQPVGQSRSDAAIAEAEGKFQALAAQDGLPILSMSAQSDPTTATLALSFNYQATVSAIFGQMLGFKTYPISGFSTATASAPSYVDIYFLVDTSASMGVGATPSDQLLMNKTAGMDGKVSGCMIACHAEGTDALAHSVGAVLRLDAVKSAIQQVIASAQDVGQGENVQIGIVTFADDATVAAPMTSNLSSLSQTVNGIALAGADAGTATANALAYVKSLIRNPGDGSSADRPLTFVILATDGTGNAADNAGANNDSWNYSPNFSPPYSTIPAGPPFPHEVPDEGHDQNNLWMELEGVDPAWCSGLKAEGVNVMTLEMPYVLPTAQTADPGLDTAWELTDYRIQYIQNTLLSVIPSQLTACASEPDWHASASDPAAIATAFSTLFTDVTSGTPRLTK